MSGLLQNALPLETLVVAIDPGKISNRVWLASGDRGLVAEPVSLPTLCAGVDELERLVGRSRRPRPAPDRDRVDRFSPPRLDGRARASLSPRACCF